MSLRTLLTLGLPIGLGTLLALTPSPAPGCAVAPIRGQSVQTSSEQAVIIYDEETKTEHFIRTANFQSTSAEFGFLVPTPSKPEIAEADSSIYAALADVTKPRIEVHKVYRSEGFGCGMMPMAKNSVGDAAPRAMSPSGRPDVQVVEQKRVGNLDVSILKADDEKSLLEWLGKHGYDSRPELKDWLKIYTDQKWYLSAFKVAAELTGPVVTDNSLPPEARRRVALTGTTVRMSFSTDRPFYPYREPADMQKMTGGGSRLLRVYMLASTISMGQVGLKDAQAWSGAKVWAGRLPEATVPAVAGAAKLNSVVSINRPWVLTEFEDHASPRIGTDEVYFGPSLDQSPVERPPIIRYEYIDTTVQDTVTVVGIVFVSVIVLVVTLAFVIRRLSRT